MHDLIGLVAGALTTVAFLPQVIKTRQTRCAGDLSFGMLLTFTAGVAMWGIYGLLIQSTPIIASNAVTLVLTMAILWMKIAYSR
ncbi:MAG: SemiSWEET transporter [Vicinamibacterales bacterium]